MKTKQLIQKLAITMLILTNITNLMANTSKKGVNLKIGPQDTQQKTEKKQPQNQSKTTWLGVIVAPVAPSLASQLNLQKGVGLVVDYIEPTLPANNILKKHDIIYQVENQLLINTQQLQVLVQMHKPNDKLKMTIIRAGKKQNVEVTLGTRTTIPQHNYIKKLNMNIPNMNIPDIKFPSTLLQSRDIQKMFQQAFPQGMLRGIPQGMLQGNSNITTRSSSSSIMEYEGNILYQLNNVNGEKNFVIKNNKTKKTLFDGPVNNKKQIKKVPKKYQDKLQQMLKQAPAFKMFN